MPQHGDKTEAALETESLATEVVAVAEPDVSIVRAEAFRDVVGTLLEELPTAFQADLASYWAGAGTLGFLCGDPSPLPPHIPRGESASGSAAP